MSKAIVLMHRVDNSTLVKNKFQILTMTFHVNKSLDAGLSKKIF